MSAEEKRRARARSLASTPLANKIERAMREREARMREEAAGV